MRSAALSGLLPGAASVGSRQRRPLSGESQAALILRALGEVLPGLLAGRHHHGTCNQTGTGGVRRSVAFKLKTDLLPSNELKSSRNND